MAKFWHIRGFDGTRSIFESKVKLGYLSDRQVQALLMALAAKAGLSFDEIVGAYAKRNSKLENGLLEVRRDGLHPVYLCGSNPHFIARIIDDDA